jgi:hypothetical protein
MVQRTRNVAVGYWLSNILKGESHIDGCIPLFQDQLNRLIKLAPAGGIYLNKWVNYLAFDIVGESTFSKSFGFLQSACDIRNSISNQFKLRLYIAIVGHYNFLHDYLLANPLIAYFNLQPSMHIFDICLAAVEIRAKNTEARNDIIEQWKAQYRAHPDRVAENEILAAAVANMGAGADTVASVLKAFFYYLLRDQESLKLLREEIGNANLSDIPSYAEVRELPVLTACIKEAYRIHTPVGFGIPRVSNGATVCGRYFPPDVILSVSPWVIHRQEFYLWPRRGILQPEEVIGERERGRRLNNRSIQPETVYSHGMREDICAYKHRTRHAMRCKSLNMKLESYFSLICKYLELDLQSHIIYPVQIESAQNSKSSIRASSTYSCLSLDILSPVLVADRQREVKEA